MYKYSGNPSTSYLFAHFTGSYAEDFLKECGLDILPTIIENKFSAEIQSKFDLMIDVFLRNDQLSIQKCAYMLQEILISICESSLENSNNIQLKTSLKHIHSFFTSKISVPYLASLENLSNSRYVTVFKNNHRVRPVVVLLLFLCLSNKVIILNKCVFCALCWSFLLQVRIALSFLT